MAAARLTAEPQVIACRGCHFLTIGKRWDGMRVVTFYDCTRKRLEVPNGCNERVDDAILGFHR